MSKKIFLFLILPLLIKAQTPKPYVLDWSKEIPVVGAGVTSIAFTYLLHPVPLTAEQVNRLNPENVWQPDRFVTKLWSPKAQKASDVFFYGSFALPAALLLDPLVRDDFGTNAVIYGETFLLTTSLTLLTKKISQRPRPFVYNSQAPMAKKTQSDALHSFFSGHTSITAANCFVAAKMYNDHHPNSPARPFVWGIAATIPAVTGYLRIKGGKHYLSDVIIGYIVGAGIGILIPELHRRK